MILSSLIILHTASFFHEFWKRKQAEIEYEWDVADFEDGEVFVKTFCFFAVTVAFLLELNSKKKYHFFYLTHKSISSEINCVSLKKTPKNKTRTKQNKPTKQEML